MRTRIWATAERKVIITRKVKVVWESSNTNERIKLDKNVREETITRKISSKKKLILIRKKFGQRRKTFAEYFKLFGTKLDQNPAEGKFKKRSIQGRTLPWVFRRIKDAPVFGQLKKER